MCMQLALTKNSSNDEQGYATASYNLANLAALSGCTWLCSLLG